MTMTSKGRILCAVSGGADSMVMLHLLYSRGEDVAVGHYHHGMRGADADSDAQYVRSFCQERGIPFYIGYGRVYEEAERTGEGVEACGRRLRYEFLEKTADSIGAEYIATAHNADDQSETVLMRILRGTGTLGLAGILEKRGRIIRPVLGMSRREIEDYARKNSIAYIYDSTNSDDKYTRNMLRHQVIPLLRELNPRLNEAMARLSAHAVRDEDCLSSLARQLCTSHGGDNWVSCAAIMEAHPAVATRALRITGAKQGLTLLDSHTRAALALCQGNDPSARADIALGQVCRCYDRLVFSKGPAPSPPGQAELTPGCELVWGGKYRISCKIIENFEKVQNSLNYYAFSDSIINERLCVRARRQGDCITLVKRPGKTLKKLMCDMKIPAAQRDFVPVITVNDSPAALYGAGTAQELAARPGDRAVIVSITREDLAND